MMPANTHIENNEARRLRLFIESDPATSVIEVSSTGLIVAMCDSSGVAFDILPAHAIGRPMAVLGDAQWARERLGLAPRENRPGVFVEVRAGRFCYLFVTTGDPSSGTRLLISRVSVPTPVHVAGPPWLTHHTWGVLGRLTRRQIEVLRHLSMGLDNIGIAEAIFKTRRTVEWHLRALYRILNADDRTALFKLGYQAGLASMPESVWAQIMREWRGGPHESRHDADDTLAA